MSRKYAAGITEKRLNNQRFKKTEDAILRVFFEGGIYIGTKEIAEKVGVARSTFYHHHKTVRDIVPDYRKYVLKKYARMVRELTEREDVKIRTVFARTLFFVLQNKKVFEITMRDGDMLIVKEMLEKVRTRIVKDMQISRNVDKIFRIYEGEMIELALMWREQEFDRTMVWSILDDMVFLTETTWIRLGKLA